MRRLILILALTSVYAQFEIEEDSSNSATLVSANSQIQLFNSYKFITYSIPVSFIPSIKEWYLKKRLFCYQEYNISILNAISGEFSNKMGWKKSSSALIDNNSINIIPAQISIIEKLIAISEQNQDIYTCLTSDMIERRFINVNKLLNELYGGNKFALMEFIDFESLMHDVYSALEHTNNLCTPFTRSDFAREFFKYTRMYFFYNDHSISITLEIPLFKQITLFNFKPKPFRRNSEIVILNSSQKYLMVAHGKHAFFSEQTIKEYCYITQNRTFCYQPFDSWTCELNQMLMRKNVDECYVPLHNKNIITQFGRDTYFTISHPLEISIGCNGENYKKFVIKDSRIRNNSCAIKTPFFSYMPNQTLNGTFYNNDTFDDLLTKHLKMLNNKTIFWASIFSILVLSVIIIVMLVKISIKKPIVDNPVRLSYVFAPYLMEVEHVYETIRTDL